MAIIDKHKNFLEKRIKRLDKVVKIIIEKLDKEFPPHKLYAPCPKEYYALLELMSNYRQRSSLTQALLFEYIKRHAEPLKEIIKKEPREIVSSTYLRWEKRMFNEAKNRFLKRR